MYIYIYVYMYIYIYTYIPLSPTNPKLEQTSKPNRNGQTSRSAPQESSTLVVLHLPTGDLGLGVKGLRMFKGFRAFRD